MLALGTRLQTSLIQAAAAMVFLGATALAQTAPQGPAAIFEKRCYSCHNLGGGDKKGPDLKGVPSQQSATWLREFVKSPATLNRSGDPTAAQLFKKFAPEVMPDQELTDDQIDSIISFIDDLSRKNQQFIPAGAKLSRPVVPTDILAGMDIFTGRTSLTAGGTACISCHHLKGVGVLGGGTLGPDLTAVNVKYRDPELISILQNPNFPTMSSVFAARPLGNEEIVKLFALFQNAKLQNPNAPVQTAARAAIEPKFLVIGSLAALLALVVIDRLWKNRLRGVREQLVRRKSS